jgi:predicted dinucleotide-binding enzyme
MGSNLARLAAKAGYEVLMGSRDAAKAADLARTIGGKVQGGGIAAVADQADMVVLAVPYGAAAETLETAGDLAGKVLVDISNPITPDYMALTIGHTTSAAEEIQKLAPRARVVKAFNTIFAQILSSEAKTHQEGVQVFTAADDEAARAVVGEFIERIGFVHVAAGPLGNARYLEPMGELNIHFGYAFGWGTATAPAWVKLAA